MRPRSLLKKIKITVIHNMIVHPVCGVLWVVGDILESVGVAGDRLQQLADRVHGD